MRINLLPQPSSSNTYRTILLSVVAGGLLLGNLWAVLNGLNSAAERKQAQQILENENKKLSKLQEKAAQVQQAQETERQSRYLENWAGKRPRLQDELHLLSSLLPPKSYLAAVQYKSSGVYDLQAELPDLESVATYLQDLRNNPGIAGLTVKSVTLKEEAPPGQPPASPPPGPGLQQPAPQSVPQTIDGTGSVGKLIGKWLSLLPWSAEVAYASGPGGTIPEPNPVDDARDNSGDRTSGGIGAGSGPFSEGAKMPPANGYYELEFSVTISR